MSNVSLLIGSLMSILGMGSGLVSQGTSIHQQLNPQQDQVYQQPGQRCAVEQNNILLSGTIVVVPQPDGRMILQCVPDQRAQQ
jgi:hypothetical protein